MKKVKLTKISDDKFEGLHPNGIVEGYTKEGELRLEPEVGYPVILYQPKGGNIIFITSGVKEVIDENTFRTRNSTYKIEEIK